MWTDGFGLSKETWLYLIDLHAFFFPCEDIAKEWDIILLNTNVLVFLRLLLVNVCCL